MLYDEGGLDRSYYKEFKKVVELADVIIEVLDARDPLACRSLEVENYVRSVGAEKRIILLLNKIDLVPREAVESWLKYLREEMPAIAFKSSTQKQHNNLGQAKALGLGVSVKTQMSLGAENLLQLLKNYARNKDIKTSVTVGIVGMPNVGKSSVINSLRRTRVAHVGNRPGLTTAIQEVQLDKHIRLLDSPGIFGRKEVCSFQGMKVEQVDDPVALIDEILCKVTHNKLAQVYNVQPSERAQDFLELLAKARGKLKRGGVPDMETAAKMVLQDWNAGVIPFFTLPPSRLHGKSVRLVPEWAQDFEVGDAEILGNVQSMEGPQNSIAQASSDINLPKTSEGEHDATARLLEHFSLNASEGDPGINPQNLEKEETVSNSPLEAVRSFEFQGAEAGFKKMVELTQGRKEVGNVIRGLEALNVHKRSRATDTSEETCPYEQNPEEFREKKRFRMENRNPSERTRGKMKGDMTADNTLLDSHTKRRKPQSNDSWAVTYDEEGQFDTKQARAQRRQLKKVKKHRVKAERRAESLAEAVGKVVKL